MYFHDEKIHNTVAPSIILPELFKISRHNSILDIGCGIGTWLSVAKSLGVSEVLGVDGEYIDRNLLKKYLQEDEFLAFDLCKPLNLNKKFDLCFCLEVAEHLPEIAADSLLETISRHSDSILFSAAFPGQGGQNHLNEQKTSYWIEKFRKLGFNVYDPFRFLIWNNSKVEPWYKQNLLYFSRSKLPLPPPLFNDIVHPDFFAKVVFKNQMLENQLQRIVKGEKGKKFYLKRFFLSIFNFGDK